MKKHITYEENDLKSTLRFMESSLKTIEFWLRLMEEQCDGKRSNVDLFCYREMIKPSVDIRRMIESFNVDLKKPTD